MASFIELIAKIKQKNNGTFKLVDAQDVECEDGKGLDEVLNEKLDKNQGTDNVGKVMVVGEDGELTPTEYKSGSDNKLIGTVAKSENPNITDGYQTEMMNLKLYGKSTQGADPSPTNPQEITAISQFEGAIRNSNQLFDADLFEGLSKNGVTVTVENGIITLSGTSDTDIWISTRKLTKEEFTNIFKSGNLWKNSNKSSNCNYDFKIYINTTVWSNEEIPYNIPQSYIDNYDNNCYFAISVSANVNNVGTIKPIIYQSGDGTWQPFDSNPQEFTYTPTNPMYSTQDGSIADYVDVEKGVEVYNMKPITFNNTQMSNVAYIGSTTSGHSKFTFRLPYKYVIDRKINTIISFSALEGTQGAWHTDKINIISGDNNSKDAYYANVDGSITTKEDFLALFENDVELVYILEAPTETPIDPEQLAMLRALYTYNGVTNFLCNAPVSFDYEQSLQIVIQNIWNAIGQTNANTLLNGGNQ